MRTSRTSRLATALAAAFALCLVAPAIAPAQFGQVFNDYRGDQRINGCTYSAGQLQGALGQVPPDIEQYAPNFVDELNRALESRGRGDCGAQPAAPQGGGGNGDLATPSAGQVSAGPTPKPPKGAVLRAVRDIAEHDAPVLTPARSTPTALAATGGLVGLIALLSLGVLAVRMLRGNSPAFAIGGAARARRQGSDAGADERGPDGRTPQERLREQERRAAERLQQRR